MSTTTETGHATAVEGGTPAPARGTLVHVDPRMLELETNVRDDAALDADFVASVKEHGVLIPIAAVRGEGGVLRVRAGQRRTLAGREAGLLSVPVYVRESADGDEKSEVMTRVCEQIVENDQRQGLTEAQRARGIQQLLDIGMPSTKVAKTLTIPKKTVEAAAVAAQSKTALDALGSTTLTIQQAATLAEFEDAEATAYLIEARSSGQFDHRVSELRQKAAAAAALAVAAAPYIAVGHTILAQRPRWGDELVNQQLNRLVTTADGDPAVNEVVTVRPDLWSVWLEETAVYTDTRTDSAVEEWDVDWDIEADDYDTEPDEGLIHPRYVEEATDYDPTYYCTDLDAAELTTTALHYSGRGTGGATQTAHGAEASAEAARRLRRKTLALNKLGKAAQDVRRKWVKDTPLSGRTAPKGAMMFLAGQLSATPHLLTVNRAGETAQALLNLDPAARIADTVAQLPPTGDQRAAVIALGLVLGAHEAQTPKDAWRYSGVASSGSKVYLRFLADNGYELSDVEKVITGVLDSDTLFRRMAAPADRIAPPADATRAANQTAVTA